MKSAKGILQTLNFLRTNREYFPSPSAWEDQVLYFLMLDRFSDGMEADYNNNDGVVVTGGSTPAYQPINRGNANVETWLNASTKFCGGNLKGLQTKLGYLKRLGITAIWISPVFKQIKGHETYHGYGIQDFLDIDPQFGNKADLKGLVEEAHKLGIYVILDIILNHAGDVFEYEDGDPYWRDTSHTYKFKGFRNPDGAIWPIELQNEETFTRKGYIKNWDYYPEYIEGDFYSLKDINLGSDDATGEVDKFRPSAALRMLSDCYKYWMAYADIDGYRIDTVKHMSVGATRHFASVIHEFGQVLGKDRFYLIGEITGDRRSAIETMEKAGLNAALGIVDVQEAMEGAVKGTIDPEHYFKLFRNSDLVGRATHTWFRNKVVTMFDDHDQVRRGSSKARFCSWGNGEALIFNALALNLLTLGIPCIYYGSEQYFDGNGPNEKFLRECMFGGDFGAFLSQGYHFFDESNYIFRKLPLLIALRNEYPALRRGRQYLREISGDGVNFGYPRRLGQDDIKSLIAWSRIHSGQEIVIVINTDPLYASEAWVTVDDSSGDNWEQIFPTCNQPFILASRRNGKSIPASAPPAGLVIYRKL